MKRGTIDERGGRFRARISIRGTRFVLGSYSTREAAEAVLTAASKLAERAAADGSESVRDYGNRWLIERELSGRIRGVDKERSVFLRHIAGAAIADIPIARVRTRDVRAWLEELAKKPAVVTVRVGRDDTVTRRAGRSLSRQTCLTALRIFRGIFAHAIKKELVMENQADAEIDFDDELPTRDREDDPWTFLEQSEIDALLSCAAIPQEVRAIYTVAVYAGLRRGELWALRWDDVILDGDRARLLVRRSNDGVTKSGRPRQVPLLEPARRALAELGRGEPDAVVFPRRRGGRVQRRAGDDAGWSDVPGKDVYRFGHKWLAGIRRPVRFHDLRHTCASHLLMGTWGVAWRIEEVREMLGHASTSVTERYAHLSPEAMLAVARRTAVGIDHGPAVVQSRASARIHSPFHRPSKPTVGGSNPPGRATGKTGRFDVSAERVMDQDWTSAIDALEREQMGVRMGTSTAISLADAAALVIQLARALSAQRPRS